MQKELSGITERFIRYAKINTRSDANSQTVPSTACQFDLLHLLVEELEDLGLEDVYLNPENAFLTATLPANIEGDYPSIGFIAHVDTADFNAENIQPQMIETYDGSDIILNAELDIKMETEQFPMLSNYIGQTLITTDGTTLLGADDKSGIAEIVTAMEYLLNHPEIPHGKIRIAFGPDEEIGRGADLFDPDHFAVDFAYTVDGGPVGELQYESFNAAQAEVSITGLSVHPGTAKDTMINANLILADFIQRLPADEVPEKTEGREGFYLVTQSRASIDEAYAEVIIRDFDKEKFLERKAVVEGIVTDLQAKYGQEALFLNLYDQYYNMAEVISQDMTSVHLAKQAMLDLGIQPIIRPIRGGTDGSKISFMGIPTPNLFAGGENMHGRYEFVAVESMLKACQTIIRICQLNIETSKL